MILPLLRTFNNPSFQTAGEALEFFRQVFEGLDFMHQCHVAHRDCGDVYYLGNVIRIDFLLTYHGLEFMQPLIDEMVQTDPSKRPTMEEVVKQFSDIYRNIPKSTLRSRLVGQHESRDILINVKRSVTHYVRTFIHILLRRNPMPTPS
ncbi:hypothetical protein ABKN59_011686 [Abortiporus biennis]